MIDGNTKPHITISNCVRLLKVQLITAAPGGTKPVIYGGSSDNRTDRKVQAPDWLDLHHPDTFTLLSLHGRPNSAQKATPLTLWLPEKQHAADHLATVAPPAWLAPAAERSRLAENDKRRY
jgi:hypothetical protein